MYSLKVPSSLLIESLGNSSFNLESDFFYFN
jgi:hypothetical protein